MYITLPSSNGSFHLGALHFLQGLRVSAESSAYGQLMKQRERRWRIIHTDEETVLGVANIVSTHILFAGISYMVPPMCSGVGNLAQMCVQEEKEKVCEHEVSYLPPPHPSHRVQQRDISIVLVKTIVVIKQYFSFLFKKFSSTVKI